MQTTWSDRLTVRNSQASKVHVTSWRLSSTDRGLPTTDGKGVYNEERTAHAGFDIYENLLCHRQWLTTDRRHADDPLWNKGSARAGLRGRMTGYRSSSSRDFNMNILRTIGRNSRHHTVGPSDETLEYWCTLAHP